MLALLAMALATQSPAWEHVIYYCKVTDPVSEFSLVYDRRGSAIRDVKIVDRGTPRLSPVSLTRWRGKVEGQGVKFDFHHTKNGFWTSGEMRLAPREEAGHFALTWSSTSGGVGGHVPIGSPEESADCIPEAMASR